MIITIFSLFVGILALTILVKTWILHQESVKTTEIYTCSCGSGSHFWLSDKRLECNECGRIKEVNQNGIIVDTVG